MNIEGENIPKEETEEGENVKENKKEISEEESFERCLESIKQGEILLEKGELSMIVHSYCLKDDREKYIAKMKEVTDAVKIGEQTPEGQRQLKVLEYIRGQ